MGSSRGATSHGRRRAVLRLDRDLRSRGGVGGAVGRHRPGPPCRRPPRGEHEPVDVDALVPADRGAQRVVAGVELHAAAAQRAGPSRRRSTASSTSPRIRTGTGSPSIVTRSSRQPLSNVAGRARSPRAPAPRARRCRPGAATRAFETQSTVLTVPHALDGEADVAAGDRRGSRAARPPVASFSARSGSGGHVDRRGGLAVGLDADAGGHGVAAVGDDPQVHVVERDRLARAGSGGCRCPGRGTQGSSASSGRRRWRSPPGPGCRRRGGGSWWRSSSDPSAAVTPSTSSITSSAARVEMPGLARHVEAAGGRQVEGRGPGPPRCRRGAGCSAGSAGG